MENFSGWISRAFNLAILNRNRYNWVDYLRGVVILLVVYHHTYLGIQRSGIHVPASVADANMVFFSFRMPLFFIISGIFTSRNLLTKPVGELVWAKYDKIFYPYLIWAFLQVTLQIIMSRFTNAERDLSDYLYIFYQPRMLDQFWYLPALFNATMVFIWVKTRLKPSAAVHLLIGLALYFSSPFLNGISMISDWMRFYLFFVIGDLLSDVIFRKSVQQQLKRPLVLLVCLPVFIAAQVYYLHNNVGSRMMELTPLNSFRADPNHYMIYEVIFLIIALIGCSTLIILSFLLEQWKKLSFLRVLGFHSLYIYITHIIIVGFVRFLLTNILHVYSVGVILFTGILFGVTLPIMFYNLLGRGPLWFLFSSRRKRKELLPVRVNETSLEPLPAITPSSPEPKISSTT
ncbi:MAG: acyltransferase family protein [Flavisolibacter sp.]